MNDLYPDEYAIISIVLSLDTLGKDYHDEYVYGVEYHTRDLWIRFWRRHIHDARTKWYPPPSKILSDLPTSCWSTCMRYTDTVRRVLPYLKFKHDSNAWLSSSVWYKVFEYIYYSMYIRLTYIQRSYQNWYGWILGHSYSTRERIFHPFVLIWIHWVT